MSGTDIRAANRPDPDQVLVDIADYVCNAEITSDLAYETAHYCLMDTLACGFQALDYPACTKLLGPLVPGATLSGRCARSRNVVRTRPGYRALSTLAR